MSRRLALLAICLSTLLPSAHRFIPWPQGTPRACVAAGRGAPPRQWVGCAEDPGPSRELSGHEKLAAGVAIDLNSATPEDLAGVPGLSPRLAMEVVRDRLSRGRYPAVDDLIRVRGIGPARLARARRFLATVR